MTDQETDGEQRDISWQDDSLTISGTLTQPVGCGPFPAVVMVAGSGPTDLDWNSPLLPGTNGSARLLAQALACEGIASVRYDKRGSGPHVREQLPLLIGKIDMQSFADELAGAVRILADQQDIRSERIFALANSEGTLHALNYQVQAPKIPLAGLVLTGPPGRPVGVVARSQLAAQVASLPQSQIWLALYDAAIARFLAGEPVAPDPALPEGVQTLLKSLETPANLPFARELWVADAASLLKEDTTPTLVLIGKKDLQIDWQADGDLLKLAARGREHVSFCFPENANHVLKEEMRSRAELMPTEIASSYNGPETRLDPEALTRILQWLAAP